MEEKEEIVNINFFKKIWYSITKFEQYPAMATEGFKRAIKYLIMLTVIVTIFIMIGTLVQMKTLVTDLTQYVKENVPEFSYADGNLSMEMTQPIIIQDIQYETIDKIVIDTLSETEEQKQQIENDNLYGITIFLFKDEIKLATKTENNEVIRQEYTYNDFIESYTGQNIERFNKAEFVNYLTSEKMSSFYIQYGTSMFIYLLIVYIILGLLDAVEIAILGWITTVIARIRMRFVAIYNMAIYALTLPMFLNILYIVVNYFTDFTITYFQVAYITIAYIYLAATIFIIKDDFIKRMQEVEKIKKEQLKVREEIKQEEQKKEEEKEEQENKDDEPQGSET